MNTIVSGMGAISLLGKGLAEHESALFSQTPTRARYAPETDRFETKPPKLDFIPLTEEKIRFEEILGQTLNRSSLMILAAFEECLQRASLSKTDLENKRVAFIMGTTAGATNTNSDFAIKFAREEEPPSQAHNDALDENPARSLQKYLPKVESEIFVINNACTSSSDAIALGSQFIEDGLYDYVFAGGSDEIVFQSFYGFRALQLVSPTFSSRPFDKERNGILLSEGAAVLCLESHENFQERFPLGDHKAEGKVLAAESVTEAFHQTGPSPEAVGMEDVYDKLFKEKGFDPADIDFVNAHATGTRNNDMSEGCFLQRRFPTTKVFATKGYTGHCLGAVGALEAIFCFLAMKRGELPASLGFENTDEEIGISPTRELKKLEKKRSYKALSTAIGFGGVNSALILEGSSQ